jgi:ubiquitin fusion degradation protein 1
MIDLDKRASKFEQEQIKRREDAKRRKLQEERLQQQAKQREKELAEYAVRRREELEYAEQVRQQEEAEEMRLTGGVRFCHVLTPFEVNGDDDKVLLSEDCLTELTQQDVFEKRPALFQLQVGLSSGEVRVTHCGVREFSAATGSIGLPPKVLNSLGGDLNNISKLQIKYVVLAKCSYAKLVPQERFFEVGSVKRCLEENLQLHSTLTEGDVLTVWYRGQAYRLVVSELRPERQVSLLDSDVLTDLELAPPSTATAAQSTLPATTSGSATPVRPSTTTGTTQISPQSVDMTLPAFLQQSALLEPEPEPSASAVLAARFKLPSGKLATRRFLHSISLQQMMLYVWQQLGGQAVDAQLLQISTRFPARSFTVVDALDSARTLVDCGLALSSESFFVKC